MIEKLSKEQLLNVQGGISRGEYCDQLKQLMTDNYRRWDDFNRLNAGYALERECTSQGY